MAKQFAVIGDPVEHSLSPVIHHQLYELYGVAAQYQKIHIPAGQVQTLLPQCIVSLKLCGFNVTMPHKQAVIPLLAGISKEATLARSVNTVCCKPDGLHGHTTDAIGFSRAVAGTGRDIKGMPVVFLGAGSVCGALALHWSLQQKGPITIIARNPAKAQSLVTSLQRQGIRQLTLLEWTRKNLEQTAKQAPLLVNTTPLGMVGNEQDFQDLGFLSKLPKDALVYDLIYQPRQTKLLETAQKLGHQTANGIDMLIYQAMAAFELFLDIQTQDSDYQQILAALDQQGLL